jgi:beta-lactamase class A
MTILRAKDLELTYEAVTDPGLQSAVEDIDHRLRSSLGMGPEHTALGLMDLETCRLALIHPDRQEYGASVPKIGILYSYFVVHPDAATNLAPAVRHELGLIAKASDNALAAKYSRLVGLRKIQEILTTEGFYSSGHGGGIWVGKHYGYTDERYGDPLQDHSHAVTARQVLRFFLLLEQGKLVSPDASETLRQIFLSPDIAHSNHKFVKGLAGRPVEILRKSGEWEDWNHDAAIISGPGRRYILVGLTHHPKGEQYLTQLAIEVDDLLGGK